MVPTQAPEGLIGWLQAYGNVVAFFAQIVYWAAIAAAAWYAVVLFRTYVIHKTGGTLPKRESDAEEQARIDEFVE